MRLLRQVAGIGLLALLFSAGPILVPGGQRFGPAYAGSTLASDPSRTSDMSPLAGDPDGPTGDVAPPTKGTISEPAVAVDPPAKRLGAWAHWKLALRFLMHFSFVR